MTQTVPDKNGMDSYVYLTDISRKDKPWDKHRRIATKIASLYKQTSHEKYAERMDACANWLEFDLATDELGTVTLKLQNTRFCRVRYCPVCQWRHSLMWRARFFEAIPKVVNKYPKARFIFLTLTVRNSNLTDLRATINQMNKAWNRLANRRVFPAIGYVRSLEVTRSKDNTAHPHFHCILLVPGSYFGGKEYLSKDKWIEMWKSCLRIDYLPSIDIRAVKDSNNIQKAILEVLKYSVKEEDLAVDGAWLDELTKQMDKVRSVSVGGVMREFLKDDEPEDLIHINQEVEIEDEPDGLSIWFGWREMVQRYTQSQGE